VPQVVARVMGGEEKRESPKENPRNPRNPKENPINVNKFELQRGL